MKGNGKSRNHGQKAGGGKLGQAARQAKLMQGGNHTSHAPKAAAACSAHSHMLALPEPMCPLCSPFHGLCPPCKLREGNRHPDGRSEARQAMPGLALPHTSSCRLIQQPLETSKRALLVGHEGNRAFCEGLGLLHQGIGGMSHGSLVGARACWETKGRAGVRRGLKWQLPIQGQQGWTRAETRDPEADQAGPV